MTEAEENVRSIQEVIPERDRAHARLRRELIERAARGEDVYAYRSIVGRRNVWAVDRRIPLDDGRGGDAA